MTRHDIHLLRKNFDAEILPLLLGRVFHVTTFVALDAILTTGEIRPNADGTYSSPFGSSNSFFRKRGCVSVFDLRTASAQDRLSRCHPLQIGERMAFLFVAKAAWSVLVPWTRWEEEQTWGEKIVPHAESGYPGAIPTTSIEEVLQVTLDDPPDPLIERLTARFQKVE